MNTLEALYFPTTEIFSGSQFPLFLLFPKVHILQPIEPVETGDDTADIFKSSGLCQAHTPCPLGENRDRFLHLIRDIRNRKDDYAAQLSNLTVAALSEKKSSIDDTSGGIVSSLLGTSFVQPEEETDLDVALWQARLLLKIAEQLDRDEEEVAMQMALLDDEEDGLFKTLQGEMDEEEETLFGELLQLKSRMARPPAGSIINRLKAWSKIYSCASIEPQVWLTQMEEAADSLLEKYEEKMKLPAQPFLQLEIPANIGWGSEDAVRKISEFTTQNSDLLNSLRSLILSGGGEEGSAPADWSEVLQQAFPKEDNGRSTVIFYNLAGISCGKLLGKETAVQQNILAAVRWQEQ